MSLLTLCNVKAMRNRRYLEKQFCWGGWYGYGSSWYLCNELYDLRPVPCT